MWTLSPLIKKCTSPIDLVFPDNGFPDFQTVSMDLCFKNRRWDTIMSFSYCSKDANFSIVTVVYNFK